MTGLFGLQVVGVVSSLISVIMADCATRRARRTSGEALTWQQAVSDELDGARRALHEASAEIERQRRRAERWKARADACGRALEGRRAP